MEKEVAEMLADTVIAQFRDYPLLCSVDRRVVPPKEKLKLIILQANVPNQNDTSDEHKRMQFPIPNKTENEFYSEPHPSYQVLFPERVITMFNTGYSPSTPVKIIRSIREAISDSEIAFDPEVVCRRAREDRDINSLRQRAFENKYLYGLMCRLTTYVDTLEGSRKHPGERKVEVPLLFIPGISLQELDILSNFGIGNQIPSQEKIPEAINGVFEDRFYKTKFTSRE